MNAAQCRMFGDACAKAMSSFAQALCEEVGYGMKAGPAAADSIEAVAITEMFNSLNKFRSALDTFCQTDACTMSYENKQSVRDCLTLIADQARLTDRPDNTGDRHHCSSCGATDKCDCVANELPF